MVARDALFSAPRLLLVPYIGGEFMPHLDEGALWVRATMPYTISFEEAAKFAPQIRNILMSYPQVTEVGSELARPDDGTDPTGFFNCEFYVGLKPYKDTIWKQGSIRNKAELTEDLQKKLAAYPGVIFNFTQPAEDAVDEALTGLKSALAVKIYGAGFAGAGRQGGRDQAHSFAGSGLHRADRGARIGPAQRADRCGSRKNRPLRHQRVRRRGRDPGRRGRAGGHAGHSGRAVVRPGRAHEARSTAPARDEIGNLLVPTPSGQQVPISELANIHQGNGASFIYRENNSRYIGVQFSIEGRDLARAVDDAQKAVRQSVALPQGYTLDWGGEYSEYVAAREQFAVIGPLAILLIFMILFALYGNFKFPVTVMIGVVMTEPVGALLALKLTHTPFSVSSVLGLLALMGVSVETAVILVSYINKLRLEGQDIRTATREAVAAAAAAHHDDGAGRLPGPAAGGALHRHRLGHAEAVRDRHRRGTDLAAVPGIFRQPGAVPNGRETGRRAASVVEQADDGARPLLFGAGARQHFTRT